MNMLASWKLTSRLREMVDADLDWISKSNAKQSKPLVGKLIARGEMIFHVTQSEDGHPIADARAFLGDGRVLVSDAAGVIRIGGLPAGGQRAVVIAAGRHRKRPPPQAQQVVNQPTQTGSGVRLHRKRVLFDTTSQRRAMPNIRLPRAGQFRGEVVDERGEPIAGAWVGIPGSGRALALDGQCAVADSRGRLRLSRPTRWMLLG